MPPLSAAGHLRPAAYFLQRPASSPIPDSWPWIDRDERTKRGRKPYLNRVDRCPEEHASHQVKSFIRLSLARTNETNCLISQKIIPRSSGSLYGPLMPQRTGSIK